GQLRPEGAVDAALVGEGPHPLHREPALAQLAHRLLQGLLVGVEGEVHQFSPSLAPLRSGELVVLRATGEAGSPSALFFLGRHPKRAPLAPRAAAGLSSKITWEGPRCARR